MSSFIRIRVLRQPDGDEFFHLEMTVSNGQTQTSQDFYAYADVFANFGQQLTEFPKSLSDKVTLKIGGKDDRFAYYLFLEAFCYSRNGHSAIKIHIDNNGSEPNYHKAEFFIKIEPATINKLGTCLRKWNPTDLAEISVDFW